MMMLRNVNRLNPSTNFQNTSVHKQYYKMCIPTNGIRSKTLTALEKSTNLQIIFVFYILLQVRMYTNEVENLRDAINAIKKKCKCTVIKIV